MENRDIFSTELVPFSFHSEIGTAGLKIKMFLSENHVLVSSFAFIFTNGEKNFVNYF